MFNQMTIDKLVGNPIFSFVGGLSVYPNFNSGDQETRWDNPIKSKVVNCDFIKCGNIARFNVCELEFAHNNYLGGNQFWMWESEPGVYILDKIDVWGTGD